MYALLLQVKTDPVFVVCRSQYEETVMKMDHFAVGQKCPALTSKTGLALPPSPPPPKPPCRRPLLFPPKTPTCSFLFYYYFLGFIFGFNLLENKSVFRNPHESSKCEIRLARM